MSQLGVWRRHSVQAEGMACTYSIKQEWDGAVVLITGGSGYIGSVVLEQLLRTTNVGRVYLLLRPRRGQPIQARADALLQGPLFHKVRENASLLSKVRVVGGNISLPGLGLTSADRSMLLSSLDFIIHCAADIRLEADIQETLTANFEGTRTVLELAAAAGHLKALVHVSSAFVNMNQPRSSIIDEQIYPLRYGSQVVDVEQLAQELLALPKRDANARAAMLLRRWNFPNTYTMGKHMSEQLVTRYQSKQQLPVAIVRPSLVSAIAGEPYPGYVGNWAGPIGAAAAMAIGMFDCLESVASQPMGVWDVVPADLVASSIIAAAAAVSAGVSAAISRATKSGSIVGATDDAAVVLGQPHAFSQAAQAARLQQHTRVSSHAVAAAAAGTAAAVKGATDDETLDSHAAAAAAATAAGKQLLPPKVASLHGHSPAIAARLDDSAMFSHRTDSLADLAALAAAGSTSSSACDGCSSTSTTSSPTVHAAPRISRHHLPAVQLTHQLLERVHHHGHHAPAHDVELSPSDELLLLCSEGTSEGQQLMRLPLLIVHAATSSTYPITLMEGWNSNLEFFDAHPPPFRISMAEIPEMPADFVPKDSDVLSCRRRIGWKIWAFAKLLKLAGRDKEAKKLQVGFDTFCVHNNSKTDKDLVFATHALVALEAALEPAEASEYLLVWRPITNRQLSVHNQPEGSAAAAFSPGSKLSSVAHADGSSHTSPAGAAAADAGRAELALAPMAGDVVWRRYLHTQMAGVYRMLFGQTVVQRKMMVSAAVRVAADMGQLTAADYVEHDFQRIK